LMEIYNIAGFNVALNCGEITKRNAKKYIIPYSKDDIKVDFTIATDMSAVVAKATQLNTSIDTMSYLYEGNEFARQLLKRDAIWIHASAVVVDGNAYLFSAPCGTGKSTHTSKWIELFGKDAYIINDDKPVVRIIGDDYFVYGSPWSGKYDISVNARAKLKGICFLHRSKENHIDFLDKRSAIQEMMKTSSFRITQEQLMQKLDIFDKIISNIPIYKMGCTPTVEAAKLAYDFMSK